MSDSRIDRATLFKVNDEDRKSVIAAYDALKKNAIKVLKPSLFSNIQDFMHMARLTSCPWSLERLVPINAVKIIRSWQSSRRFLLRGASFGICSQ